jgi:aminoglycoside N3'-acetyltransferase
MVHASLRKLGPVEGGAGGLLSVILELIGSEGTLVFPLGSEINEPFNALTSPAEKDIGVLAEVFRQWPGTKVNDHPAGRFGALGHRADWLLKPTPLHDYLGPGSLLDRFTQADGIILRLGADPDTMTLTHYAEYLADLPHKDTVAIPYIWSTGREEIIRSLDDCNGIVQWDYGDYFSQILLDFLEEQHTDVGQVGSCRAELISARLFVSFAVDWMEKNLKKS